MQAVARERPSAMEVCDDGGWVRARPRMSVLATARGPAQVRTSCRASANTLIGVGGPHPPPSCANPIALALAAPPPAHFPRFPCMGFVKEAFQ